MTDRRLRRALLGPALAVCMLLTTACSSDEAPAPAAPADTTPAAPTSDSDSSDTTVDDDTATTNDSKPAAPADDVLAAAIEALGTSYRFDSVITTPAGDNIAVNGIRVDTTSRYTVEAGGATVEVITVDNAVWLRQDGSDEWLASGENPPGDPLAPLASPTAITRRVPTDDSQLVATYNGRDVGLDGIDAIDINVEISGATITFTADTDGTTMTTTLIPDASLGPVTQPDST